MSRPLRFIPDEALCWRDARGRPVAVVELTVRTVQGRFLLRPTPRNTELIEGVIGRAVELLDFELYAYAAMSNHLMMLVGVRSVVQQAAIMEYVHGNIARELGRPEHSDWPDRFWARRGSAILCLSEEDLGARFRYTMSNSVKENLVVHPSRWPGAHSAKAVYYGRTPQGVWVDRAELYEARRRKTGPSASEADFSTVQPVRLAKLPCWRDLSDAEYRDQVRAVCHEVAEEAAAARAATGAKLLGAKGVLAFPAHHRPDHVARSPAPPVHARDPEARDAFIDLYRVFVACWRDAWVRMTALISEPPVFPPGGCPPGARWAPGTG